MRPYYEDEFVTLYHGDCEEILPSLVDVDAVVTSPPYNKALRTSGDWIGAVTESSKSRKFRNGYGDHDDAMPHVEYVAWQRRVLTSCWESLSDTGAIFYNHKPRIVNGSVWLPSDLNPGLPMRQVIVWDCGPGVNLMPGAWAPAHEWLMLFAKPGFDIGKRRSADGDVWRFPPESSTAHPAPFPLALPARIIEACRPSLVADPFSGTGTTLRAAKDAGIKAIGIELSEAYCEIAAKRLAQGVLNFGGES